MSKLFLLFLMMQNFLFAMDMQQNSIEKFNIQKINILFDTYLISSQIFSSDGRYIALISEENQLNIYDTGVKKIINQFRVLNFVEAYCWSPNRDYLAVVGMDEYNKRKFVLYSTKSLCIVHNENNILKKEIELNESLKKEDCKIVSIDASDTDDVYALLCLEETDDNSVALKVVCVDIYKKDLQQIKYVSNSAESLNFDFFTLKIYSSIRWSEGNRKLLITDARNYLSSIIFFKDGITALEKYGCNIYKVEPFKDYRFFLTEASINEDSIMKKRIEVWRIKNNSFKEIGYKDIECESNSSLNVSTITPEDNIALLINKSVYVFAKEKIMNSEKNINLKNALESYDVGSIAAFSFSSTGDYLATQGDSNIKLLSRKLIKNNIFNQLMNRELGINV